MKNINELSSDEKAKLMRQEFAKDSPFERVFKIKNEAKIPCQEFYQKFRDEIKRLLVAKKIVKEVNFPLEELHLHVSQEMRDYNFGDGINKISTLFYENDEKFLEVYSDFVKKFLKEKFNFPFYFQAIPTIRIHCPNSKNSDHYPRYHTDIQYGHPTQEINLWFSFTKPIGEQKHGFRMMSIEDSLKIYDDYDYHFEKLIFDTINDKNFTKKCDALSWEVDTKEGEILAFDARCNHTGEPLINHTRISMDIRIIAVSDYQKMPIIYQGMGRKKILFSPGNCYQSFSSDEINS